ncbi:MAG TPA: hypothetical protein ENJ18_02280 [Nannocystis exedens]|nr:hypothetical protein [Nannocystis exedens]
MNIEVFECGSDRVDELRERGDKLRLDHLDLRHRRDPKENVDFALAARGRAQIEVVRGANIQLQKRGGRADRDLACACFARACGRRSARYRRAARARGRRSTRCRHTARARGR